MDTEQVFLLLGSNMGNRLAYLAEARRLISGQAGAVLESSHIYQTAAWGLEEQPAFLNQVLCITTRLSPDLLLRTLLSIEANLGRQRELKWGSRTIDIDILYYGAQVVEQPHLKIPHPAIPSRRFTLVPLAELAPMFRHPLSGLSQAELLAACPDTLEVSVFDSDHILPAR